MSDALDPIAVIAYAKRRHTLPRAERVANDDKVRQLETAIGAYCWLVGPFFDAVNRGRFDEAHALMKAGPPRHGEGGCPLLPYVRIRARLSVAEAWFADQLVLTNLRLVSALVSGANLFATIMKAKLESAAAQEGTGAIA